MKKLAFVFAAIAVAALTGANAEELGVRVGGDRDMYRDRDFRAARAEFAYGEHDRSLHRGRADAQGRKVGWRGRAVRPAAAPSQRRGFRHQSSAGYRPAFRPIPTRSKASLLSIPPRARSAPFVPLCPKVPDLLENQDRWLAFSDDFRALTLLGRQYHRSHYC